MTCDCGTATVVIVGLKQYCGTCYYQYTLTLGRTVCPTTLLEKVRRQRRVIVRKEESATTPL